MTIMQDSCSVSIMITRSLCFTFQGHVRFDVNGSRIGLNAIYQLSKLFIFDSWIQQTMCMTSFPGSCVLGTRLTYMCIYISGLHLGGKGGHSLHPPDPKVLCQWHWSWVYNTASMTWSGTHTNVIVKTLKKLKRCRDGMPKSMQTRWE